MADVDDPPVRIRGIYATALTVRCREAGFDVVDPSSIVQDRFDASFPNHRPLVTIDDTVDHLGVAIVGRESAIAHVVDAIAICSEDTHWWPSPLSYRGLYRGEVVRTEGSGGVVSTGGADGFLPYGETEAYIDRGDQLLVQVIDPEPPWTPSRRPVLSTNLRVPGIYLTLRTNASTKIVDTPSDRLGQTIARLGVDPPDEWGIEIHPTARGIDLDILESELAHLTDIAMTIDEIHESIDRSGPLGSQLEGKSTAWCRFGRRGRFDLDRARSSVVRTMDGHHRLKAGGHCAGSAVDFVERLDIADPDFSADPVFDVFGPSVGDRVRIDHGKPTGRTIVLGTGEITERPERGSVTVQRTLTGQGSYDELDVPKESGDVAVTTFVEGQWWYPTVYRSAEGEFKGTYVNVGTPLEIFPDRVCYLDLYVDVVKSRTGEVRIVDRDELQRAVETGDLSPDLADRANAVASAIVEAF